MIINAYTLAERFIGTKEVPGATHNPAILAMLRLDMQWPTADEVPWCSAFANFIAWLLRLPRSKSLRARSWLTVGTPINLFDARPGFDVVILKQASKDPGPGVVNVRGHVGFFSGLEGNDVLVLGGNQSNSVCLSRYPVSNVLGVRRLYGN